MMWEKVNTLWPEIVIMIVAFAVMLMGLSPVRAIRRATGPLSLLALVVAAVLTVYHDALGLPDMTPIAPFVKIITCLVGGLLLLAAFEMPDEFRADPGEGAAFNPTNAGRGEFFGFLLLSLVGLMLVAGAEDLVWLFLALELTSLPTYIVIATSRDRIEAQESSVKYFFMGAFSAAVFLYGFALIYLATGATTYADIAAAFAADGVGAFGLIGLLLAVLGIAFKIAAFPMHVYAADVYQGAATPITAFLAFVPKAAGFVALIGLLSVVGWPFIESAAVLSGVLWVLAVVTMFLGNILALLQHSVKRALAYSSIAHTGYMLVGLTAASVASPVGAGWATSGLAAVMFYLLAYGVMNLGAFAVLAILKRQGEEAETYDDLRGLATRHPALAAVMAVCVLSLLGAPPLVGFWGKLLLILSAVAVEAYWLAIFAFVNSVIAAAYYLWILRACFAAEPTVEVVADRLPWRRWAAGLSAVGVVVLSIAVAPVLNWSESATGAYRTGGAHTHTLDATPAVPPSDDEHALGRR